MIIVGVDAHKRTHTLVAIDGSGSKLKEKTVAATSGGHHEALNWAISRFSDDLMWAVEDSRVNTRLLEHDLLGAHQRVVRVPTVLMAKVRRSARTWGKSDPIDALAVARAALREPNLPVAEHDTETWELKLLMDRRDDLVGQRVAVMNRLSSRLHLIDPQVPAWNLKRSPGRQALQQWLTASADTLISELALEELADIDRFSHNIDALYNRISKRVALLGSTLTGIAGCGDLTAARLICGTANVTRFRNEAAFARYVGVAPVPAWSGSTHGRMVLTRSGNRAMNSALQTIAVVQIRLDTPGRRYYLRRLEGGDTKAGARRCLKRKICRSVFTRLLADHRRRQHADPRHSVV
ncbi:MULTISPECIES: IS110 family transposase [Mycobacteriaceae]|uniref:Transposase n=1 Tax=Mycolicibacterium obuense TaxID=1807 RepID=A0A0M2JQG5_9MYCO|nr:IS110 family transposase [Mycolicibacterium obuense]KKE99196.1 transposase [Mycolicibacterium obuense]OKH62007.1 transposase [Mycobacterium sp. SWH-M1]